MKWIYQKGEAQVILAIFAVILKKLDIPCTDLKVKIL